MTSTATRTRRRRGLRASTEQQRKCQSDSTAPFRDPTAILEKARASENLVGFSALGSLALYYNVLFYFLVRILPRSSSPSHTKRRDGIESEPLIVLRLFAPWNEI